MIFKDIKGDFDLNLWLIISSKHKFTRKRCIIYNIMCNFNKVMALVGTAERNLVWGVQTRSE